MSWFRVHDELLDDPKIQRLSAELVRALLNLWCLASRHGGFLPPVADVAFALRITEKRAAETIADLSAASLMDEIDGRYTPHNWSKRQYKTDVSTERVQRYRKQKAKRNETVSSYVSETTNETAEDCFVKLNPSVSVLLPSSAAPLESKEDSEEQACGRHPRKRGEKTPLPADFAPNFHVAIRLGWDKAKQNLELERFCASARAHDRRYVNWQAAFDNWCVSPFQKQETTDGLDRESGKRDFRQAHRELKAFGEAPADGEPSGETVRLLSAAGIRE